jgi:hypothetical protein
MYDARMLNRILSLTTQKNHVNIITIMKIYVLPFPIFNFQFSISLNFLTDNLLKNASLFNTKVMAFSNKLY